jgi:hypothetical protein
VVAVVPLDGSGAASYLVPSLTAGTSITASFNSDPADYLASSTSLTQVVRPYATVVKSLRLVPQMVKGKGRVFTLQATLATSVPGGPIPLGTVTFRRRNAVLGSVPLQNNGVAIFPLSRTRPRNTRFTAVFQGSPGFAPSPPLSAIL